jgi:alpha-tubulin suppressor-like RCC1 family protein
LPGDYNITLTASNPFGSATIPWALKVLTLHAWGKNTEGQSTVPADLSSVVAIAAGEFHSLALKADGTVVAWGFLGLGTVPAGLSGVVAIAAGSGHSLALKADGTVAAWGSNNSGQTTVPAGLSGVVAIAAGDWHSLALKADGTVTAWGDNTAGQSAVPPSLSGVLAIAAGGRHSLSLSGKSGTPIICSGRRWITEAAGARAGTMAFAQRIIATGNPTSYAATGLPAGLTLNTATGVISGNVTQLGTFPLTVSATNASGTGHAGVILTVNGSPSFTSTPPPVISGSSVQLNAVGFFAATGLPADAVLDASTGRVSGLLPGDYNIALTASNPYGSSTILWALKVLPIRAWGNDSYGQSTVPADLSDVVTIVAGSYHSLALKTDGTVITWGNNYILPAGLSGVVAIAAGGSHSLALKADGTVIAWGNNTSGQTTVPVGLSGVVAIAAGGYHSLALKANGTVIAWGYNEFGQGTVPVGLSSVVAIAAGRSHSLALKADSTVVAWGFNTSGQSTVPAGLAGVAAIAAGNDHSLALRADGSITAWGDNTYGQTMAPAGLTGVVAIAAGGGHSFALKADGFLAAWGANYHGQSTVPAGLNGVVAMACGETHSLVLRGGSRAPVISSARRWITEAAGARTGTVAFSARIMATGSPTSYAATGLPAGLTLNIATGVISGTTTQPGTFPLTVSATNASGTGSAQVILTVIGSPFFTAMPPPVISGPTAQLYAVGSITATGLPPGAALDASTGLVSGLLLGDYNVTLTASNPYGSSTIPWALKVLSVHAWGQNAYGISTVPANLSGVVAIAAGSGHTLALKSDGTISAWGYNGSGETTVPAGLTSVVAIAAGPDLSLALKADGTVAAWGYNAYGKATVPAGLSGVVALAAGDDHCLALKGDGTIASWGDNSFGQRTVPAGLSGVMAIDAGGSHSLALKADGSVVGWGKNNFSQSTLPANLSNVVAISAGTSHSLALKADGSVTAWGDNTYGQTMVPAGLAEVVAISGGSYHSLALKADGSVVAWGYNGLGQSTVPAGLSGVVAVSGGGSHSLALIRAPRAPILSAVGRPLSQAYPPAVALAQFSAAGLPPGLEINAATGVISGTPTASGGWTAAITMSNRAQTRTESLSFTIADPAAYQAWLTATWPGGGAASAPGADPDGDGAANLLEYAIGADSLTPVAPVLPGLARNATGRLVLTLDVRSDRMVAWEAQFAGDLTFSPAISAPPQNVPGAPAGMVRLQFTDPLSGSPRRLGRLRATVP